MLGLPDTTEEKQFKSVIRVSNVALLGSIEALGNTGGTIDQIEEKFEESIKEIRKKLPNFVYILTRSSDPDWIFKDHIFLFVDIGLLHEFPPKSHEEGAQYTITTKGRALLWKKRTQVPEFLIFPEERYEFL